MTSITPQKPGESEPSQRPDEWPNPKTPPEITEPPDEGDEGKEQPKEPEEVPPYNPDNPPRKLERDAI